jgi:hypothetical protein
MSVQDRRSGEERRTSSRYRVQVDVEWEATGRRSQGTLSDVGLNGCFVLCSGEVEDGESVRVFVPIAGGMRAEFRGRVTNHVIEIGFGLKFDELSPAQRDVLAAIVQSTENP